MVSFFSKLDEHVAVFLKLGEIWNKPLLPGVPDVPHAVNDVSLLAEGNSVGESSLPSVIVSICDDRDNTFKTTDEVGDLSFLPLTVAEMM